jgi:hypothetical protein
VCILFFAFIVLGVFLFFFCCFYTRFLRWKGDGGNIDERDTTQNWSYCVQNVICLL